MCTAACTARCPACRLGQVQSDKERELLAKVGRGGEGGRLEAERGLPRLSPGGRPAVLDCCAKAVQVQPLCVCRASPPAAALALLAARPPAHTRAPDPPRSAPYPPSPFPLAPAPHVAHMTHMTVAWPAFLVLLLLLWSSPQVRSDAVAIYAALAELLGLEGERKAADDAALGKVRPAPAPPRGGWWGGERGCAVCMYVCVRGGGCNGWAGQQAAPLVCGPPPPSAPPHPGSVNKLPMTKRHASPPTHPTIHTHTRTHA